MANDFATLSWWGCERLVRAAKRNCFVCKDVLSIEVRKWAYWTVPCEPGQVYENGLQTGLHSE